MKNNRSLELSIRMNKQLQEDLLGPMSEYFPTEQINGYREEGIKRRDRLYSLSSTVQTMIISAAQEDKSLQQSVLTFRDVLGRNRDRAKGNQSTAGKVSSSKEKDISLNTASYTEARQRVPIEAINLVFDHSRKIKSENPSKFLWHGREVFIADGTYIQLQDSPELRTKYSCQFGAKEKGISYPQALLEGIIQQGSGRIYAYQLLNRHQSELDGMMTLMGELPQKSILLADDLYSCFAVFCLAQHHHIEIVVPAKRSRNYSLEKKLGPDDELVKIPMTQKASERLIKQCPGVSLPKTLLMRRIAYTNPATPHKKFILMTSIVDPLIDRADIIALYASRWDIEISIRELKTIMKINVLRSKTDAMIHKELAASLIAYNFIRSIIQDSVSTESFPPKEDFFYDFYSFGATLHIDKCGRVYHHWSPGRYPQAPFSHSPGINPT